MMSSDCCLGRCELVRKPPRRQSQHVGFTAVLIPDYFLGGADVMHQADWSGIPPQKDFVVHSLSLDEGEGVRIIDSVGMRRDSFEAYCKSPAWEGLSACYGDPCE